MRDEVRIYDVIDERWDCLYLVSGDVEESVLYESGNTRTCMTGKEDS
jgi:hypothetical protein